MSSEKTEEPTAKKIRDARMRGEVAKSRDFTQTVLILAIFGYLIVTGPTLVQDIMRLMVMPAQFIGVDFRQAISVLLVEMFQEAALIVLPVILIVLVVGIFFEALQTGLNIAFEALKPSAKKLNVVSNAQNIFSKNNLVEFLKNLFKVGVLSLVIYLLVRDALGLLISIPYHGLQNLGQVVGELLRKMLIYVGGVYVVVGLADLAWQRHQYRKKLMMTKDEVKQEYKTSEGDPHIKSQRKGLHRELLAHDAVASSRKASVLITNPTHYAIAVRYDESLDALPVVLAKGEGALAERMMAAAREAGVPVMQNIELAHALFDEAELDQYVPSDLVEPVAEVLRLVRELAAAGGSQR